MFFLHSKRARRVAGCTALALSAGMLLAGPASADSPAPRPAVEKPVAGVKVPELVLPKADGARSAGTAGATAAGTAPRADLDGDGLSNLVFRGYDGQLYSTAGSDAIYRGDGATTFVKDVVPLGDLDGDGGRPEMLTLSTDGDVTVYGNVTATSSDFRWGASGWQIYNKVFTAGDLSGDGKADVLARTPSGELWVYRSTGTPGAPFHARQKIGNGWQAYDQLIGVGDSDGDGYGDFLARTYGGLLYFYGSTGSPYAVKPRKQVGTGWQIYNQIVGIDDATGDGIGDVIARGTDGTLWAYTGTGGGTYAARRQGSVGWQVAGQIGGAGNVPAHGKEELIARDKAGTLYWYYSLNNGLLSSRQQTSDIGGWAGATLFNVNSVDDNGESDILEIGGGHLYHQSYQGLVDYGGGWGIYNQLVGPGDLNGDGTGDFVARDRSGVLWLYRTNQYGNAVHARVKVGSGWGAYDRIVGSGDYSGDGLNDLVARTKDGTLYLYQGTGQAGYPFKPRVKIGGGWNVYPKIVAPGDITGDGKADLLAVNSGGELFRYSGTGEAGTPFKSRVSIGRGYQTYNGLY
ncbi:VCBS repeat-containing protein [Streptomyces zaomyceticus]|uniref:VCBS repeat-containing protein n=1 Tax=Streptomyces zaomyceticus TaxID=68286 RepID=A0ABZ1LC11_9ACTN|nr:VCBS repeat-containing protein [Streptomyces zaomyceticus]